MIRALMAVLMGAAVITAVLFLPNLYIKFLLIALSSLGLLEYGNIFFQDVIERYAVWILGVVTSALVVLVRMDPEMTIASLAVVVFLLSLLFMMRARTLEKVADRLGLAVLGVMYIGVSFPIWGWLFDMDYGRKLVLFALVPACLCDTFAFIFGKVIGGPKFAPKVSPNKTWAGFVGALVGSLIGSFAVRELMSVHVSVPMTIVFALMIWIVSPLGDLVESMLKRSSGVKDSGSLIPGHGGILDRLDALIFTGPAAYIFARLVF